jgi:hypothetical protein
VPKSTIHSSASPRRGPPLITTFPRRGMHATVAFIGFAEAYVLARTIGTDHVLGSRRLYTDGAEVL